MPQSLQWHRAFVVKVFDGDTTLLRDEKTGRIFKARHIGYNTPETHHPERGEECFGRDAAEALENLIAGKTIEYASDPLSDSQDKYRRDLVHIRFNSELVSLRIIQSGLAFAYHRFNHSYKEDLIAAETAAKAARIGLWGACRVFPDPRYPDSGDQLTQGI